MKRYDLSSSSWDGAIVETTDGDYVLHEEAAAIIAEKDKDFEEALFVMSERGKVVAELSDEVRNWKNAHALLKEQFHKQQEQLRASNERLDRYTRISESGLCLGDHLDCIIELAASNEALEAVTIDRDLFIKAFSERTEALVAAEARISNLADEFRGALLFVEHSTGLVLAYKSLRTADNLAALEAHDKEVRKGLIEEFTQTKKGE